MSKSRCYVCGKFRKAFGCCTDLPDIILGLFPFMYQRPDSFVFSDVGEFLRYISGTLAKDPNMASVSAALAFKHPGITYDPTTSWFTLKAKFETEIPSTGKRNARGDHTQPQISVATFDIFGMPYDSEGVTCLKFLSVLDSLRHHISDILRSEVELRNADQVCVVQASLRRMLVKKLHRRDIVTFRVNAMKNPIYPAAKIITAAARRAVCDGLITAFDLSANCGPLPNLWERMLTLRI